MFAGLLLCTTISYGQSMDSLAGKTGNFSSRLFKRIQSNTSDLNQQLTVQTQKYLNKMARQEERMKQKMYALDSNSAKDLYANSAQQYAALSKRLQQDTGSRSMIISGAYQPYTDSLRGALAFLQKNPQLLNGGTLMTKTGAREAQLQKAVSQLQSLQAKMQDAAQIQQYMQQRGAQIQQYLGRFSQLPSGMTNEFNSYKAKVYYYGQQVNEYKEKLNDPDKLFTMALAALNRLPSFSGFMKSHSMLSGLVPGGGAVTPAAGDAKPGQGLPSRDEVLKDVQGQMSTNGAAAALAQKNTGSAIGVVDQLRSKLTSSGGGDLNMPDFTPNNQKTRSFLHRLEFGVNLQTKSSSYFYPTTLDFGVSLGYKLNEHNRIGIGASYKTGWTGSLSHLQVDGQGASIRSFADIQIKKSWFASGGLEYNYQPVGYSLHSLSNPGNWQPAGLIGFSKVLSMKTKLVKNTKLQFLWDFLSYRQVPAGQPFVFRVGYSF